MNATEFWLVAAAMAALAAVAIGAPLLWAGDDTAPRPSRRRALVTSCAIAVAIPLLALAAYAWIGSPSAATGSAAAVAPAGDAPPPHAAAQAGAAVAGSLDDSIRRLEQRLEREPGDRAGWELLAQSYEFQGRSADAQRARARVAAAPASAGAAPNISDPATAAATPGDTAALAASAEAARRARDYPRAIAAFEQLVARKAMTADLWADYADAVGASRGRLDDTSAAFIAQALALDAGHPKALWLLGSLRVERGDYRGALATWERLHGVLPADSPDAKLIARNIEEARARSATPAAAPGLTVQAGAALPARAPAARADRGVVLRGEVALDPRSASAVPPGAVLFVFARAAGQPGPPLAVMRTSALSWPVAFALDDSLGMVPGRRLSDFHSVTVEARLARDGSANAAAGDPRGATPALDPRKAGPLRIVLSAGSGS